MNTIDTPSSLKFSNGFFFPTQVRVIGFVFLVASIFVLFQVWWLSIILMILGSLATFTSYGVRFSLESNSFSEFVQIAGFIPIVKSKSLDSWKYFTVMPIRVSTTMYSRPASQRVETNYFYKVCLMHGSYKVKRELIQAKSKTHGEEIAKELAFRLQKEFFEYDPQVVKEAFRR